MELNLSEVDNTINPYGTYNSNYSEKQTEDNYWEKPKIQETKIKKKKVSFNDILSNMNLVVNKQGVLQFMSPKREEQSQEQPQEQFQSNFNNNPIQPVDPAVKHSFIYNKYFKDYADVGVIKPEPRVPKTMEEYRNMLIEDKIKELQRRKMVEQVKSKKIIFTSTPGVLSNPTNIQPTKNNLRRMSFT
jgi:hypothetical protein